MNTSMTDTIKSNCFKTIQRDFDKLKTKLKKKKTFTEIHQKNCFSFFFKP